MRLLIAGLEPGATGGDDLPSLVQRRLPAAHFFAPCQVELAVSGAQPLSAAEKGNLFRIVQEALNNTAKHAHASRARVRLHLETPFRVEIEDDGLGFEPQQFFDNSHVGLRGMRERAAAIGWELAIESAPGAGTRITVAKLPATALAHGQLPAMQQGSSQSLGLWGTDA
jgi:two-component system nitrate/nitrite sensor histidine kinase NarX